MKFETGSLSPDLRRSVDLMKARTVTNPRDFYSMDYGNKLTSFTVSGNLTDGAIGDILNRANTAIANGDGYGVFAKSIDSEVLKNITVPKTVFRNAVNNTYQSARFEQQNRTKNLRPYLQYRDFGDDRVRPAHAAMNGIVAPFDSDFWANNYPPNGHLCRCAADSLTRSDVRDRGLDVVESQEAATNKSIAEQVKKGVPASEAVAPIADKGWTGRPTAGSSPWANVANKLTTFEKENTISILTGRPAIVIPKAPPVIPTASVAVKEAAKVAPEAIPEVPVFGKPYTVPLYDNVGDYENLIADYFNLNREEQGFKNLSPVALREFSQAAINAAVKYPEVMKNFKGFDSNISEINRKKAWAEYDGSKKGITFNPLYYSKVEAERQVKRQANEEAAEWIVDGTRTGTVNHELGHFFTDVGIIEKVGSWTDAEIISFLKKKDKAKVAGWLEMEKGATGANRQLLIDGIRGRIDAGLWASPRIPKSACIGKYSRRTIHETLAEGLSYFLKGHKLPEKYFKYFNTFMPKSVVDSYEAALKAGELKEAKLMSYIKKKKNGFLTVVNPNIKAE